jgi:kumamolisin
MGKKGIIAAFTAVVCWLGFLAVPAGGSAADAGASAKRQVKLRVVMVGLAGQGKPMVAASQISYPGGSRYRHFLTQDQYRRQFGATSATVRKIRTLRSRKGVRQVILNPTRTAAILVMRPPAARRLFCAGPNLPGKPCRPAGFKKAIRQVSLGEIYPDGPRPQPPKASSSGSGTPQGCADAIKSKTLTPNQISTAYEVDALHQRGLDGSGVRVATLSGDVVGTSDFETWAKCFGLPAPKVSQPGMPSGVYDTQSAPDETVLDVEALSFLAPKLDRVLPIFVPLDNKFNNALLLFLFGALDPGRLGGKLPDILSISDGICEYQFRKAEKWLAQRFLAEAAAIGITTLAASGDAGFLGCDMKQPGANFPASSRFATAVGGTNLGLDSGNSILSQPVWSTYATKPAQGAGTGGGPSRFWPRPAYQAAPGLTPALQKGRKTRLLPDVAAMASFYPGIATYEEGTGGWGPGGGTSAATPLTAAMVALVLQQEREAGRPPLGLITPLLYRLSQGSGYGQYFRDVTVGTNSRKPKTKAGQTPAGGAAQPGYDLATGLGSLKATAFADAVASFAPAP